jgi:hypothetical protein
MMHQLPAVMLETSVAMAHLKGEPEALTIEMLLALAEAGAIRILMSDYARREIVPSRQPEGKLSRLYSVAELVPNVARIGDWRLGVDMLGHDASEEIEKMLPSERTRQDLEQLLSYAARHEMSYLVTKDKRDLLKVSIQKLYEKHGFNVGTPAECIEWLRSLGIHVLPHPSLRLT